MSSWKKASKASQKTHRERHQPESRQHLGLLEKKKDYVARAKNYNANKETLKLLKKRALNKNPDEYYFHMVNSKTIDGIHREKNKKDEHTPAQIKLMETQDLKYVAYKRNIESKKVQKMQSRLHMLDLVDKTKCTHKFFVDDDSKEAHVDIATRLNTHPSLLGRRTNRPTLEQLKTDEFINYNDESYQKLEQAKYQAYKELEKRMERERELSVVEQKLLIRRALKDKKQGHPTKICAGTETSAPIFKWKFQRKR